MTPATITTPSQQRATAELLDLAEGGRVAVLLTDRGRVEVDAMALPANARPGARLVPDGQGGYTFAPAPPSPGIVRQIVGAMISSLCALFRISPDEARALAREQLDELDR